MFLAGKNYNLEQLEQKAEHFFRRFIKTRSTINVVTQTTRMFKIKT